MLLPDSKKSRANLMENVKCKVKSVGVGEADNIYRAQSAHNNFPFFTFHFSFTYARWVYNL